MNSHRIFTTLVAAGAASVALAGPARADSIAYVKAGDIWLTPSDGSREFQVTGTGDYSAVSQADDGTLLGTAGGDLRHLDRQGSVLSDIRTPVSTNSTTLFQFFGPFNADISPSGQTLAYGWVSKGYQNNSTGAIDYEEHNGTGFSHTAALTGFTDDGFKYSKSWDAPEFIDDQTVLVGNGPGWPSDPFAVETVGSGDPKGWFTDPQNMHPLEPTISRNKRVIAAVVGPDRQSIMVYRDEDGQLMGPVDRCFTYGSDGKDGAPAMESPTLNAAGTMLAYSDGHVLQIAPLGDMTSACPDGVAAKATIAGATSPDWGPAEVPLSRTVPLQRGGGAATQAAAAPAAPAPAQGQQSAQSAAAITLAAPAGRVKNVVRCGVAFTVHAPQGTVSITAAAGKTVVASRTVKVGPSGRASITLKLSRKGAARVRAGHAKALVITAMQGTARAQIQVRI